MRIYLYGVLWLVSLLGMPGFALTLDFPSASGDLPPVEEAAGGAGSRQELVMAAASPPTVAFTSLMPHSPGIFLQFSSQFSPTSIVVERAASAEGPWTVLATLTGAYTSYHDTPVPMDETFYYRLKAVSGDLSSYSSVESAMYPGTTVTLAEPVLQAGKVLLSATFSNPHFRGGILRREGESGEWVGLYPVHKGYLSFTYTDTRTALNATYHYKMVPYQSSALDRNSNEVTVTLPEAPPGQPDFLKVTDISASKIRLAWDDVGTETGYRIHRRHDSTAEWQELGWSGSNVTAFVDTTAEKGHVYVYRVTPVNGVGEGPAVESQAVAALDLTVTLEDDFDPALDATQWSAESAAKAKLFGLGPYGHKSLYFGAPYNTEGIETRPVDASAGGLVEFRMKASFFDNTDLSCCDPSAAGSAVVLEYAVNDEAWRPVQTFNLAHPSLMDWTHFVVHLPPSAWSQNLRLRWRHESPTGAPAYWLLDDVKIRSVTDSTLRIVTQPETVMVMVGSPASLSVAASRPEATLQWYKDNVLIPEATQATYAVARAEPAHGGSYVCEIQHGETILRTSPVFIGVFQRNPIGGFVNAAFSPRSFSMSVDYYPPELGHKLSFSWSRMNGANLEGIGRVIYQNSLLWVDSLTAAAFTTYQCRVTYASHYTLDVGPYEVRGPHPVSFYPMGYRDVVARSLVDIPILASVPEAVIKVSGLPKGLKYDPATWSIRGRTSAPEGDYTVTLEATYLNEVAVPEIFILRILPFPVEITGSYGGLLEGTDPAFWHGGQVAFKITAKGSVSGSLFVRGKARRFIGFLEMEQYGPDARLQVSFEDREVDAFRLIVDFDLQNLLEPQASLLTPEHAPLAEGPCFLQQALGGSEAPYAGSINVALLPEEPLAESADRPQGNGFLNLKVTNKGTVICKGRLADGQAVTGATLRDGMGKMPVFMNLYRGTGSLGSVITYRTGQATGTGWWGKDDQGATAKDRLYKRGFPKMPLTVEGGQYLKPGGATHPAMDLQVDLSTLDRVTLTSADLEAPALTQALTFNSKNQAVLPHDRVLNPHGLTLKLKATTGTFTGKFKLEDPHPQKPGSLLSRPLTFQGCLIPGQERGTGYFLLPELPAADAPRNALGKTPVQSGRVDLAPAGGE